MLFCDLLKIKIQAHNIPSSQNAYMVVINGLYPGDFGSFTTVHWAAYHDHHNNTVNVQSGIPSYCQIRSA